MQKQYKISLTLTRLNQFFLADLIIFKQFAIRKVKSICQRPCYCFIFFLSLQIFEIKAQGFIDVAAAQNLIHTMNSSENWGYGVSFFDFDNDGWDDLTLLRENDSIYFYKNLQGNYTLLPSFIFGNNKTKSLLWVDYDNDGDNDIMLSASLGQFYLYQNDGNFNFTDVTVNSGLANGISDNYGVSFGDYNNDGFLDLYVSRYKFYGTITNNADINLLYRNNGNGSFTDVTNSAGVGDSIKPSFIGGWFDYDKDGFQDLYVLNDRSNYGNSLYRNNGNETFTNVSVAAGAYLFGEDPMSISVADFDRDGDLDIYMSNSGPIKIAKLLVNNGNGTFSEQAQQYGLALDEVGWGATWIDYDNNGFQDLYVSTSVIGNTVLPDVRSYFSVSNNAQSFTDSPQLFSGNHIAASFASAKGDINNDGFADLIVSNARGNNAFLWQNNGNGGNYIKVTLEGIISNRMAIGSWITVYAGGETFTHYTMCGENFLSQSSQHQIIGVGNATLIDSIKILYLSGIEDKYYSFPVNSSYYFIEGNSFQNLIQYSSSLSFCEGDSLVLDAGIHAGYLWSNGSNTRYLTVFNSGSYFVDVTNQLGIVIPSDTIDIFVSNTPQISPNVIPISCFGETDGAIILDVLNQTNNYSIQWNNGALGDSLLNLNAGNFTYSYSDIFGCYYTDSISLISPYPFNVQTQIVPYSNGNLGSIQFLINGGTPPYLIYFNGNSVIDSIVNLLPGQYIFEVQDAHLCSLSYGFVIPNNSVVGMDISTNPYCNFYPNPIIDNIFYVNTDSEYKVTALYNIFGLKLDFEQTGNTIQMKDKSYYGLMIVEVEINNQIFKYKLMKN
jgi:hypothetical protein